MKSKGNLYIVLFIFQLFSLHAISQKKKPADTQKPAQVNRKAAISVFAKAYGDSIVLRWAPNTNWAWSDLNQSGYLIERIDLSEAKHPRRQVITAQPLKPLSLEQFKTVFNKEDQYAAIAAQCLYGKNFAVNIRKGQGGVEDKASVWNSRYVYAVQVADYNGRVAAAEALRYSDNKVQKNGIYIYRVYAAKMPGQAKIDTGNVMVQNKVQAVVSKPHLTEVISRDRIAEIHWGRVQPEQYSSYYVERSADGKKFTSLTRTPYFSSRPDSSFLRKDSVHTRIYTLLQTQQVYVDSLPQDYHPYYYRIRGINTFAELSDYSDTLSALGVDLTPPAAAIMENPKFLSGRKIQLKWKKPLREKDFKGYLVSRAHLINGPYTLLSEKLIDPSAVQFTDTAAFEHGQNFYILMVVDTAGNHAESIPAMAMVPDKTPPAVPKGLKGFIQKDGLVHLSWNANTEVDLKGYKVYFANSNSHVYSQITISPDADTTFTDSITLRTLTKEIWYKVVAVDMNNNHSAYSEPLRLRKPDIVPPVPPLASKIHVDTGGVQIDWIQSSSEDVVNYLIYRKESRSDWKVIARVKHDTSKTVFHFTDFNIVPFKDYTYCAEAVDEDSLHSSRSAVISASVKTIPDLPPLKTLTAVYDDKTNQVRLKWQYNDKGGYFFVLYKAMGNDPLTKFQSADSKSSQYTDFAPPGKTTSLRYAIQVVFQDSRGRTRISSPVAVNIPEK